MPVCYVSSISGYELDVSMVLAGVLVMEVGGRNDMVIAVPLGEAEAARWQAAAESMWAALSAADDEASAP